MKAFENGVANGGVYFPTQKLAATQFILDAMQTDCHTSLRNSFFWTFHPFPRQFSISNANLTMTKTKTITRLP